MTSRMSAPLPRSRLTPAPVGDRVIAGAIDLVACGLVVAALGLLIGLFMDSTVLAWAIAGLIVGVPREIALAVTGWSPGGRLRGVRLVDVETGGPPGGRLLLHLDLLLITVVPTFGLGAVVLLHSAARDPHGQGYHDRVAGLRAVTVRGDAAAADPSAQPGWTGRDTETGSPMFFRPSESPEAGGRGTTFDTSAMGASSDDASQALAPGPADVGRPGGPAPRGGARFGGPSDGAGARRARRAGADEVFGSLGAGGTCGADRARGVDARGVRVVRDSHCAQGVRALRRTRDHRRTRRTPRSLQRTQGCQRAQNLQRTRGRQRARNRGPQRQGHLRSRHPRHPPVRPRFRRCRLRRPDRLGRAGVRGRHDGPGRARHPHPPSDGAPPAPHR